MKGSLIYTINRICQMEMYFDTIKNALENDPSSISENPLLCRMLEDLTAYYDGGQWMADFKCDEEGLLPKTLKRGILSEDAIYNLLCEIKEI